ncbi:MAG: hypothetical protein AAGA19_03120 [Pseudomonadota bacterium]
MQGELVELRVQDGGKDELVYQFRSLDEATAQILYLREFFPGARFLIQPLRH